MSCEETYIPKDMGLNDKNDVLWHNLDGSVREITPWIVIRKRPMGCQCINMHTITLFLVINCNTDVQVGHPFYMYFITLYNLQSNQEEDIE